MPTPKKFSTTDEAASMVALDRLLGFKDGAVQRIPPSVLAALILASPALTGNPTAPTQAAGNSSTRLATTAFVQAAVAALVASAPGALDTLNELAAALGNDANFATTMTNALAAKADAPATVTALAGKQTKTDALDALGALTPAANKVPYFTGSGAAATYNYTKANTTTAPPTAADNASQGYSAGSSWLDTNSGTRWTCLSADNTKAVWTAYGAIDHPGYKSGLLYPPFFTGNGGPGLAANLLVAHPIFVAQRVTVDAVVIRSTTTTGTANLICALYTNNGYGDPGALIAVTASTVVGAAGVDQALTFAQGQTLEPGIYWIAYLSDASPTLVNLGGTSGSLMGGVTVTNSTNGTLNCIGVHSLAANTYAGGFPSTFGTNTARRQSSGSGMSVPLGHIRIA